MHRQFIYSVHYKPYYTQAINPLATKKKQSSNFKSPSFDECVRFRPRIFIRCEGECVSMKLGLFRAFIT